MGRAVQGRRLQRSNATQQEGALSRAQSGRGGQCHRFVRSQLSSLLAQQKAVTLRCLLRRPKTVVQQQLLHKQASSKLSTAHPRQDKQESRKLATEYMCGRLLQSPGLRAPLRSLHRTCKAPTPLTAERGARTKAAAPQPTCGLSHHLRRQNPLLRPKPDDTHITRRPPSEAARNLNNTASKQAGLSLKARSDAVVRRTTTLAAVRRSAAAAAAAACAHTRMMVRADTMSLRMFFRSSC